MNDNHAEDLAPIVLAGEGPFLFPRARVVSVSVTPHDVLIRLATIDEQIVEVPIAIGALPDLAMGIAAALRAMQPDDDA